MLPWLQNMHEFHDAFYLEVRWDVARAAFLYALFFYTLLFLPLMISHFGSDSTIATIVVRSESTPVLFMNNPSMGAGKPGSKLSHLRNKESRPKALQKKATIKPTQKNSPSKKNSVSKKPELKKSKPAPCTKTLKNVESKKIDPQKTILAPPEKKMEQKKNEQPKLELPTQKPELIKTPEKEKPEIEEKNNENTLEEVFIGHDEHYSEEKYDPQTKAHIALSSAIARAWKAPHVNIKQPTHVIIEVDSCGKAHNVTLEQKSGIPLHDIESRAAALRTEYPQEFWGKKIKIIFGD